MAMSGFAAALNPYMGGPSDPSQSQQDQQMQPRPRMQWGGGGNPQGGISFGGNFGGQQYGGRQQMRPMMRPQPDMMPPGASGQQMPSVDQDPNAAAWGGGMPRSNAMQGMTPDQQTPSERPEMMGSRFGMQFGGGQPGQQGMRFGGGMGGPQQGMQFGGNFGGRQMRQY